MKPPFTHLTLYPEGPHPMLTIFEEVEKGHLAQDSMLLNSPEMKPLPLYQLLRYERVFLSLLLTMSLCVPSLVCLGQHSAFTTHTVHHGHSPYFEPIGKKETFNDS